MWSTSPESDRRLGLTVAIAAVPAITLLALVVRLYALDTRSLWLDEILTSQPAHLAGPGDVIAWSQAAINQMPLFYMFTWLLGRFGDNAVILRLPAAVAGTLVVPAVYLVGRRCFGTGVALIAALLAAVMPYMVWYSQEARNYSLLMLLTTLQMYFAFRAVQSSRAVDWAGLVAVTTLNLYTHYLALLATVAAGVFITAFLVADPIARATWRTRAAIIAAGGVAGAVMLALGWRRMLKGLYAGGIRAVELAGTHRLLAALAVAVIVVIAIVLGLYVYRRSPRVLLALASAALVAALYGPWIPSLRVLVSRPDQTLGQIHLAHAPNLADAAGIFVSLGLTGLILVALLVGLATMATYAWREHAAGSVLALTWIGVPLLVFGAVSRQAIVGIDLRYLTFLIPAAAMAIAVGVVTCAAGARRAARRLFPLGTAWLTAPLAVGAVAAVVLAQAVAGLAHSYGLAKNDYRSVAQHIAAGSPPQSVVLAVGNYSDWTVICLDYYFRQLNSNVKVVDARQLDGDVLEKLGRNGAVWGVVIFPSPDQLSLLSGSGTEHTDFVDSTHQLYVTRSAASQQSAIDQAKQLLRWELPLEPGLSSQLGLLDLYSGGAALGPDLLPPLASGTWSLQPGATLDGDTLSLRSPGAASITAAIEPSKDYVVSLTHSEESQAASLTVYVLAFDPSGHELATLPSGSGYSVVFSPNWKRSYFAFTSPVNASSVQVLVRIQGAGQGAIRGVALAEIAGAS